MKLKSILCGMLALAAAFGCKDEITLDPELNVSRTAAEIAAEGGAITVEVTSNTTWNAQANQNWISAITPSQGQASEEAVTVTITAEENEETDGRTAVITFKAGPVEKTMVVTQLAKSSDDPSDEPVTGTDSDLFVAWTSSPLLKDINRDTTNPNCFYQAENVTAEGYGNGVLTSILGKGSIKYWSVNKSTFTTDKMRRHIGNDGEPMAYGVWTGDHFLFEAEYNLPEKSNVSISFGMRGKKTTLKYWLLEYKDGNEWKPAGKTETLGDVVYNVVCGTDEAPAKIDASVVMTNATDKVQFRLACAAPISIDGKTLDQPADNSYVRIAPEVPIIIKGGAITESDQVIKPAFSIDKTELAAEAEGGNETIVLTSNMSWTATSDAEWVSVLPLSGEASESAVTTTVTVEANPSVESRSATLTYSATYGNVTFTQEVTVSQEGKEPEPVVGTDCDLMVAWTFSEGADMKGINVKTFDEGSNRNTAEGYGDKYINATIGAGKVSYYQVDKSSFNIEKIYRYVGKGGEPVIYGAWEGDHFLFEAESQTAIPANSNVSISFGLYGSGSTSMKDWLLEYKDGDSWKPVINVESNNENNAAKVNATVILSQSTNKVSFRLACTSKTTIDGKEQSAPVEGKWVRISPKQPIIIKGSAITDSDISSVLVPAFKLDKKEADAEAAGSTITLEVTSNMAWTAVSNSDWATVSPANGTASESVSQITVTVAENTSAEPRTAEVTVTATYGNVSFPQTLTITQAGKQEVAPEQPAFSLNTVWDLNTAEDNFAESEGAHKEAGDHGKYINATTGNGKLTYVQVDKTSNEGTTIYRKYGKGDVMAYGAWEGDYFLFEANSDTDIPANTQVSISFYIRGSNKTALRDWTLEYYDNGTWKTAIEVFTMTSSAQEAAAIVTLANAGKTAQFRLRCTSTVTIEGKTVTSAPTVAARISRDKGITIKSVN